MWNIIATPEGRYAEPEEPTETEEPEHENRSNMMVMLVSGQHREVIARVGFARRHTKHPDVSFPDQLRTEVDKARKARDAMVELLGDVETLR